MPVALSQDGEVSVGCRVLIELPRMEDLVLSTHRKGVWGGGGECIFKLRPARHTSRNDTRI